MLINVFQYLPLIFLVLLFLRDPDPLQRSNTTFSTFFIHSSSQIIIFGRKFIKKIIPNKYLLYL